MDNYVCKIASREELEKRWDYLIKIHSKNNLWVKFRDMALRNFDNKNTITYIGILDGNIICELTAYVKMDAFIGDISEPSGLLSNDMAYLAAFRTNNDYEGKGYFSKLYHFAEEDLRMLGYKELSLGVSPEDVRNILIYFHYGFSEYIKTTIEKEDSREEFVNFYKKKLY